MTAELKKIQELQRKQTSVQTYFETDQPCSCSVRATYTT